MAGHCADSVDKRRATIRLAVSPEAFFEINFAEQHMNRMDPGEIQVEQMPEKGFASCNLGPADSHSIRFFVAPEPVFSVEVMFEGVDYIEQAMVARRHDMQIAGDVLLLAQPSSN